MTTTAGRVESNISAWGFTAGLAVILAVYLGVQLAYAKWIPLNVDEFHGTKEVLRLLDEVPYRDYRPYKTVLGYYLQLPPLLLGFTGWQGLVAVKLYLALMNVGLLGVLAWRLARLFRREAVLLSVGLMTVTTTFLERSAEIRVDMMTSWIGLGVLLALMGGSVGVAGFLAGVGFLVSQKAAFFLSSGGLALVVVGWRNGGMGHAGRSLMRFVAWAALPIAAYLAMWGAIGGVEAVLEPTFGGAAGVALRDVYDGLRISWVISGLRNPLFWGLAIAGLYTAGRSALITRQTASRRKAAADPRASLAVFALALGLQAGLYSEPWPYFILIVVPTAGVLVASLLDDILLSGTHRLGLSRGWGVTFALLGVLYPGLAFTEHSVRSNDYQRENFVMARALLGPGDSYWAGANALYDRDQIGELGWLDQYNRVALRQRSVAEHRRIVQRMAAAPPRVLLHNYRLSDLPEAFGEFISRNYEPLWGSVWIYSPSRDAESDSVSVGLDGTYELVGPDSQLEVGGERYGEGAAIQLSAGKYGLDGPAFARLRWRAAEDARVVLRTPVEAREFFQVR
ncbi:MAG: hypothetical protein ABFS34_06145 [Gemmatimonadota bacterium]